MPFIYSISAALRACSNGGTTSAGSPIIFASIKMSNRVSSLSSFRLSGKFIVETPGIYLISVYISTNTNTNGYYYINKNGNYISYAYRFIHNYYTTSGMTIVEKLDTDDIIYVKNGHNEFNSVEGSCLSIIQIQ